MVIGPYYSKGVSYIELLIAVAIGSVLMAGLSGVIGNALESRNLLQDRADLNRQARFAMQRMIQSVSKSELLLLPLNDKSYSNWDESIREETIPPTTPTDNSSQYSAVLAITLPHDSDLDGDGTPDADNDGDGRFDEDPPADIHNDNASGISLIDDDGDGNIDELVGNESDDESITVDDDPIDGYDNDDDNNIDEDPSADMNGDGCAGICGVDDDEDNSIDEGGSGDDDEDGQSDEDWYDAVVYYLNGNTLMERMPVPWDENGDSSISGLDFVTSELATNVTKFRVERIKAKKNKNPKIKLQLILTSPNGNETVDLKASIRVGKSL